MQYGSVPHQHRCVVSRRVIRYPPQEAFVRADQRGKLTVKQSSNRPSSRTWCDGTVVRAGRTSPLPAPGRRLSALARDTGALVFVADMYGVQLDQLADVLAITPRSAAAAVARWRAAGIADAAVLSPGPRWVWLTDAGLRACGLPYTAAAPALSRLAHLRAVTAARLALAATSEFAASAAYWRSERNLRASTGGRVGLREHVADGEVHWPDSAPVPWAGECWAIEAELAPKTAARTVTIMREVLTRTGDYGCPAADVRVPGRMPRHARVIYVCSPAARAVVTTARDALGGLAGKVEIRLLPRSAELGEGLS